MLNLGNLTDAISFTMKLMTLSIFVIYFVVASTGYPNPNPLGTTKVDNVEDRGNHYKKSCFCYSVKEINF